MLALLLLAACTHEPDFPGLAPELFADQEGADVILTVQIFDGGDPGLEAHYDLAWVGDDGERKLMRRQRFDPELADERDSICLDDPTGQDTATAGGGEACGDDCSGNCVTWYAFDVVDPCQPAGQVAYELRLSGEDGFITAEHFYVMDMGAECEGGGCSSVPVRPRAWWMVGLVALGLAYRRR